MPRSKNFLLLMEVLSDSIVVPKPMLTMQCPSGLPDCLSLLV